MVRFGHMILAGVAALSFAASDAAYAAPDLNDARSAHLQGKLSDEERILRTVQAQDKSLTRRIEAGARLVRLLIAIERPEDALAAAQAAMAQANETVPPATRALAKEALAAALDAGGRSQEATVLHREALAAAEAAQDSELLATALLGLGDSLARQSRLAEAEPYLRRATALWRQLPSEAIDAGEPLLALGKVLYLTRRDAEAEALFAELVAVRSRVLAPGHLLTAESREWLGFERVRQNRGGEAEALSRQVLSDYDASLGPDSIAARRAAGTLAGTLERLGRYKEAEPLARRLLDFRRRRPSPPLPAALAIVALAQNLSNQQRFAEAEPLYREAAEKLRQIGPAAETQLARVEGVLAVGLMNAKRYAEAETQLRAMVADREHRLGKWHAGTVVAYSLLYDVLNRQNRTAEADAAASAVLPIGDDALANGDAALADALTNFGNDLSGSGRSRLADLALRAALSLRERLSGGDAEPSIVVRTALAQNLENGGRFAEAEPIRRALLETRRAGDREETRASAEAYLALSANLIAQQKFALGGSAARRAFEILSSVIAATGKINDDLAVLYFQSVMQTATGMLVSQDKNDAAFVKSSVEFLKQHWDMSQDDKTRLDTIAENWGTNSAVPDPGQSEVDQAMAQFGRESIELARIYDAMGKKARNRREVAGGRGMLPQRCPHRCLGHGGWQPRSCLVQD